MAKVISTLAYKLVMDYSQFQTDMGATKRELNEGKRIIEETRTPVERLQGAINGLDEYLKKGAIDADTHARAIKQLKNDTSAASNEITNAIPGFSKLQSLMTPMGLAAGALGASFAAMGGAIHLAIERGKEIDALGDKATKLGLAASELSLLTIAGDFGDVGADKVEAGVQKMLVSVGKAAGGNKKLGETFDALGLDASKLMQLSVPDMFAEISRAIKQVPSNAQELAFISEVFGKGNLEMRSMIENFDTLAAKASATGAVIKDSDVELIQKADDASKELRHTWAGFTNELTVGLAPKFTEILEGFTFGLKSIRDNAEYTDVFGGDDDGDAAMQAELRKRRDAYKAMGGGSYADIQAAEGRGLNLMDPTSMRDFLRAEKENADQIRDAKLGDEFDRHTLAMGGDDEDEESSGKKHKKTADEKAIESKDKFLDQLRQEIDLFGKSSVEIGMYNAKKLAMSEEELVLTEVMLKEKEAMKQAADSSKKAADEALRQDKEAKSHADQAEKALQTKAQKAIDDTLTKEQKAVKKLQEIRGSLTQDQCDAVLLSEAGQLVGKSKEPQFAGAVTRGSQEDIAARARRDGDKDSKTLESMLDRLDKLVKQGEGGPIKVNTIGMSGA